MINIFNFFYLNLNFVNLLVLYFEILHLKIFENFENYFVWEKVWNLIKKNLIKISHIMINFFKLYEKKFIYLFFYDY